ncbi:hypothetical protein CLIB1444_13S00804 [[Candida] jaroonii]|uniref:Uncharacterized protein n=1 Tax=[Candida] jaroonii TaxID=467808 RepID=A0ACA9YEF0_9ASCO|nr:hypothetical protein CLIB1444_13S00804 [[Candida] jaroonii]
MSAIDINDFKQAIEDLPDDSLISLKSQLNNSLAKLATTNDELSNEIKQLSAEEGNRDDITLYAETILENEGVIQNQEERLKVLEQELTNRGLLKPTPETPEKTNESNETKGVYL